jgi:hypothetical protein
VIISRATAIQDSRIACKMVKKYQKPGKKKLNIHIRIYHEQYKKTHYLHKQQ